WRPITPRLNCSLSRGICDFQNPVIKFLPAPVGGSLDKSKNNRVRALRTRGKLRLKQGRDVKPVRRRFHGPDFPLRAARYDRKSCFDGCPFEGGIDLEIAEKLLGDSVLRVKGLQIGPRKQANLRNQAGEFWSARRAVRHGAGDRVNDDVF